jgi:hypothetical protein
MEARRGWTGIAGAVERQTTMTGEHARAVDDLDREFRHGGSPHFKGSRSGSFPVRVHRAERFTRDFPDER